MAYIVSRTMLSQALHHVATLYDGDAAVMGAQPGEGHKRAARQFQKQAQEARDIADAIENGCSIQFND